VPIQPFTPRHLVAGLGAADPRFLEYLARLLGAPLTSGDAYVVHVERLERAGCRVVWFNELDGFSLEEINYRTHRKALVVDGVLSIVGSANFDNRSLAARLTADFERDLTRSAKLDLARWRARPLHIRGREELWSFFGEVF